MTLPLHGPHRAYRRHGDRGLADKLSDALTAFARTGDPKTPSIAWPRYDPTNEQMMKFGDTMRVVQMNGKGLDFFLAR